LDDRFRRICVVRARTRKWLNLPQSRHLHRYEKLAQRETAIVGRSVINGSVDRPSYSVPEYRNAAQRKIGGGSAGRPD